MAIEFACDECNKMLRVPDGTEGESCECPACHAVVEIPFQRSSGPSEKADNAPAGKIETIYVACPQCKHTLACSSKLIGTKGQCKGCKSIFVISKDPTRNVVAEAPSLIFSCPKCEQLFEGREEMQGRKGKCHNCGELFTIDLRKPLAEDTPEVVEPEELPPIRMQCTKCKGIMEVPGEAAGKTTACPFCSKHLTIPIPTK